MDCPEVENALRTGYPHILKAYRPICECCGEPIATVKFLDIGNDEYMCWDCVEEGTHFTDFDEVEYDN